MTHKAGSPRGRADHQRFPGSSNGDSEFVDRAVARLKDGDASGMHFLYVRYADDVCGYVRTIVNDPHDVEDISHNVFAKLIVAVQKYEQREVPFRAWIQRVARNVALDHVRARRQIPCEEIHAVDESADPVGSERRLALREALHRLPVEQRQVLVLRHVAGLTPAEIALRLEKTEGAVHGLHHRGRAALKAALRDLEAVPVVAA